MPTGGSADEPGVSLPQALPMLTIGAAVPSRATRNAPRGRLDTSTSADYHSIIVPLAML